MKKLILTASILALLSACSKDEEKLTTTAPEGSPELVKQEEANAAKLYEKARENLNKGYFKTAVENFQEIEKLYPFSNLAPKAKVMSAYAYFKDEEYDDAISLIDNFVRLNPGNEDVGFMYYLKAMSYYQQITDIKRDQKITQLALEALEEIRSRFPGTDYDIDAKYKIALIRDHLAGKEMEVGRFYLKKNQPTAALNRFKSVVEKYQDTPQIEEALYRLVETNLIIGIKDEATKYASILGHNYPSSKWYESALEIVNQSGPVEVKEKGKNWINYLHLDKIGLGKKVEETPAPKEFSPEDSEKDVDNILNKVFN
jgi:outer membrane protein assembly factor BamD